MLLNLYSVIALAALFIFGLALLAAAAWRPNVKKLSQLGAWKQYRFGFPTYALIFLAFDMEMIFMYPWAVVFRGIGLEAFLDMLVFIAILLSGLFYAWRMGGLEWE
ncbi:NADH-quinone oxidoreductase subunit A [Deinococcus detaillensis]|uniref:NADH-quinone oxidoreductase subunit n=1 Tax=Deinococcus detaillensis TaxID=2592048 RepID=A0A553UZ70_9DEIO|nr:NADH-quinone oxidoreductase subunit A [Deinococcus detaillensis]TSA85509.1 NADH-quinone oxidoreductase subunit A [Deinococcus detaillensis]